MKKGKKVIIILLCIVLVLGGVWFFFGEELMKKFDEITNKSKTQTQSQTQTQTEENTIPDGEYLDGTKKLETAEQAEYAKGILTENSYESEFCDLRFYSPEGWTILSEEEIKNNTVNKMGNYTYELSMVNATQTANMSLIVEELPTKEYKLEDFMNTITYNNAVISGVISNDKKMSLAGEEYSVLECSVAPDAEGRTLQMDYYLRKIEDRVVCIILFYDVAEKEAVESVLTSFMKY